MRHLKKLAASAALVSLAFTASTPANAVNFNFTFTAGTSAEAQAAFIEAGTLWSSILIDNVTVDLTVGTASLGAGILGQAASRRTNQSYSSFTTNLGLDATSAADATAVANLPGGNSFGMLINRTSNNPNGSGSATPYVDNDGDANNSTIWLTTANAKALGYGVGAGTVTGCTVTCDAFIQFSTNFAFDYDRTNGIDANQFDFVGVAAHEIGHALGFVSGVDILDGNSPPVNGPFRDDQFTFVSSLDLFRYSDDSTALGVIDWTADARDKYFSIDGGLTAGALFSLGRNFGDGQQASHWKDNLNIGIMDPTAARGEFLSIGGNDRLAMDVIGWDFAQNMPPMPGVPEPATWAMMIGGFALAGASMRRRKAAISFA